MTEIQNDDHDLISVDIDKLSKMLTIWQGDDLVVLTSKGAKQLIEILKEFVGDQKTISLDYYPEYDANIDYPSDALVRHNGEVKLAISIKGISNESN